MSDIFKKIEQSNDEKRKRIQSLSDEELVAILAEQHQHPADTIALAQEESSKRFPTPPKSEPIAQPTQFINTNSGCFRGCVIALTLILVPYVLNAVFLISGSLINQLKWRMSDSTSYQATISMASFRYLAGENIIIVHENKIIAAQHQGQTASTEELGGFNEFTVDELFSHAYSCALYFPWLLCSFEYDANSGYPTHVVINCPIPDACFIDITTDSLEIVP